MKKIKIFRPIILFLCVLGICFVSSCKKTPPETPKIQEAPKRVKSILRSSLAGRWYSGNTQLLNEQITEFFKKAEVKPKENVIALILPHAGYAYSGQTAAFGLKTITREYERIVVIGPSHRIHMENVLSLPRVTHYETPLGQIPLDVEFINKLLQYPLFQNVPDAHKSEHSVQIELPILQHSRKDFKLVPIVAGRCSLKTINKVANILTNLADSETLVIASSDFVHFGPNYGFMPFKENVPEKIKELDMESYNYIAKLDSTGFLKHKRETGTTICGYIPVAILLSMLEEPTEAHLLKYATSGELTGDFTNSVSYLSVVFCGSWPDNPSAKIQKEESELTEDDKKQLLSLARESMFFALKNKRIPQKSDLSVTITEAMKQPCAAFVTLKKNGHLRGCIGDIFPRQPLYKSVISNSINACFNDRRFSPVTMADYDDIEVEISALTPPEPVASSADIKIGTDGIILRKNGQSALYLPQVATEQGWDLETTLNHLSAKAGLLPNSWKEDTEFLVFQAIVFGENEK